MRNINVDPGSSAIFGGWRRRGTEGKQWTPKGLETARVGQEKHRGRAWSELDRAMDQQLRSQCWTLHDVTIRKRGIEAPQWFNLPGKDGKPLVPRKLRPLLALVHTAQVVGRAFALLMANDEIAAYLGCSRRTVQNHRRELVARGLIEGADGYGEVEIKGAWKPGAKAGTTRGDGKMSHQAPRTWRPGEGQRPSDQGANLLRLGPTAIEAIGDGWGEGRRKEARKRKISQKAARRASYAMRMDARERCYQWTAEARAVRLGHREAAATPAAREAAREAREDSRKAAREAREAQQNAREAAREAREAGGAPTTPAAPPVPKELGCKSYSPPPPPLRGSASGDGGPRPPGSPPVQNESRYLRASRVDAIRPATAPAPEGPPRPAKTKPAAVLKGRVQTASQDPGAFAAFWSERLLADPKADPVMTRGLERAHPFHVKRSTKKADPEGGRPVVGVVPDGDGSD